MANIVLLTRDRDWRDLMVGVLQGKGHQVRCLSMAIRLPAEGPNPTDLIIQDVTGLVENEWEQLLARLRKFRTDGIKITIVEGTFDRIRKNQSLDQRAVDFYWAKPSLEAAILGMVGQVLSVR